MSNIICNEVLVKLEGGIWKCALPREHIGTHKLNFIDHYILQMIQLLGKEKTRQFLGVK